MKALFFISALLAAATAIPNPPLLGIKLVLHSLCARDNFMWCFLAALYCSTSESIAADKHWNSWWVHCCFQERCDWEWKYSFWEHTLCINYPTMVLQLFNKCDFPTAVQKHMSQVTNLLSLSNGHEHRVKHSYNIGSFRGYAAHMDTMY